MSPEAIDALLAAGCSAEQLAAAFKADIIAQEAKRTAAEESRRAARREGNRQRQQSFRERRNDCNAHNAVTQRDALPSPKRKVSPCTPSKENNPLPSLDLGAAAPLDPAAPAPTDLFEDFWKAYPKREGDNPKKPARMAFDAAVKRGADPLAIIASAKAYAKRHPVPTQFCKQARFWLSQECYRDAENAPPKPAFVPTIPQTDAEWERRIHLCRLRHQWPSYLGPAPDMEGCKAPAHLITPKDRREYWQFMQEAS